MRAKRGFVEGLCRSSGQTGEVATNSCGVDNQAGGDPNLVEIASAESIGLLYLGFDAGLGRNGLRALSVDGQWVLPCTAGLICDDNASGGED